MSPYASVHGRSLLILASLATLLAACAGAPANAETDASEAAFHAAPCLAEGPYDDSPADWCHHRGDSSRPDGGPDATPPTSPGPRPGHGPIPIIDRDELTGR